ncbi:MAG: hypothetical protein AUH85_11525 [Chloroflexi bacterium 13_1_40CM_4_68_4]|nr:MAG: hypothetical protein AUH85_11525 [Chloroflexi bacterium 13_1_40CM_4_68_4]
MPSKAASKKAAAARRALEARARRMAESSWSNYDVDWWWELDPVRFAPASARPHLDTARHEILLATRAFVDSWLQWSSRNPPASGGGAGGRRRPGRRLAVR